jgi:uncharacterized protein
MKEIELRLSPEAAHNDDAIRRATASKLDIPLSHITDLKILRRSVDARGRDAVYQLRVAVYTEGEASTEPALLKTFKNVENAPKVIIVGEARYF